MLDDMEIAKKFKMRPIEEIAEKLGIKAGDLEKYGKYKAKISSERFVGREGKRGKLIMVTAMSPTPAGEGKTTTSIGLAAEPLREKSCSGSEGTSPWSCLWNERRGYWWRVCPGYASR